MEKTKEEKKPRKAKVQTKPNALQVDKKSTKTKLPRPTNYYLEELPKR